MHNHFRLSAAAISAGVRRGDLRAIDVAKACFDRLESVNPIINAVVDATRDDAVAAANAVDQRVARGEDPGPLAGVPVTIKVNIDVAGHATTNGVQKQRDLVATDDSPVVANIRAAGGIIIGRTNAPAFSMRWFTKNDLHGQTLNPRNPALTPGGSSGGASAAVAAGICAVAQGTDIAGSIRYPAYACGVHGLRPSFGRVPAFNATGGDRFVGAQLMAVSGPISRTIEDLSLGFQAMCGTDPQDPWSVPAPMTGGPYDRRAVLALAPDGMAVEARVQEALRDAARALADAGWTIEERRCPPLREAAEINAVLWMAEMQLAASEAIAAEGEADSLFVFDAMCRLAGPVSIDRLMSALQARARLIREWAAFLETYPVVLCPNSGELPFAQQSDVQSEADFERIYEAQLIQRGLPALGLPGLSVATKPIGDAPMGVQLIAGRFREDILFDAGAVIEAANGVPEVADPAG